MVLSPSPPASAVDFPSSSDFSTRNLAHAGSRPCPCRQAVSQLSKNDARILEPRGCPSANPAPDSCGQRRTVLPLFPACNGFTNLLKRHASHSRAVTGAARDYSFLSARRRCGWKNRLFILTSAVASRSRSRSCRRSISPLLLRGLGILGTGCWLAP